MVRGIPEKWRTVVVLERDTWSTIPLRIFVRRASLSSSRRCHAQILVVSIRSSRLIKAPIPGSCGTEEAEQATLRRFFGWLFTNTCHSIYLPFILYDWLFLIIAGSFHAGLFKSSSRSILMFVSVTFSGCKTRTCDPWINSPLLYRLS